MCVCQVKDHLLHSQPEGNGSRWILKGEVYRSGLYALQVVRKAASHFKRRQ